MGSPGAHFGSKLGSTKGLILNICISESFLGTKLSPLKCLKKCLKKFHYVLESA